MRDIWRFVTISLVCLSLCFRPAHSQALAPAYQEEINSVYSSLTLTTYVYDFRAGGGGAIATDGPELLYATADGRFFRVNPETLTVSENVLPPLELGRGKIGASKRIVYRELDPRVHDVVHANGQYFVTYDRYDPTVDGVRFELARFDADIGEWTVLFASPPLDVGYYTLANGGRIVACSPDCLLIGIGEYALDRKNDLPSDFAAQNKGLPWGKIIKLNLTDFKTSIYSLGHRNPEGLARLDDGTIVEAEHGPRGGDKLNLIVEGGNYGSPFSFYGTEYNSYDRRDPPDTRRRDFVEPIYSFVPSIAPTQLCQVSGNFPAWRGNLLLGSLKAQSIFNIKLTPVASDSATQRKRVAYVEPIFVGTRVRDLIELGGRIWILSDSGGLLSLETINKPFLPAVSGVDKLGRCTICHSLAKKSDRFAPTLQGVFGRDVAGAADYPSYSRALRELKAQGTFWSEENLAAFISSPQIYAPGTTMPDLHLTSEQGADIAQVLKALK